MKSLVLKRSMITYLLFILIGCQSLPVISIGGSTFKIYELLGLILLMQGIKCRRMLFLQCCFFYFIIAPCLSLLWGWLVLGYPTGFFDYFVGNPELDSFKLNYYIFPVFCLIFMFANYCAIYGIVTNNWIYRNVHRVIRVFVYVGTVISLFDNYRFRYSVYTACCPLYLKRVYRCSIVRIQSRTLQLYHLSDMGGDIHLGDT